MSHITQEQAIALADEAGFGPSVLNQCQPEIIALVNLVVAALVQPVSLTAEELAAFLRFNETTGDDGTYDIGKPMVVRLAEIGLLHRKFGAYYKVTEYGMSVLAAAKGGAL